MVWFSVHYVLSDGSSFLDIGAGVGIALALAARTPAVRMTAIEFDSQTISVLRTNLASILPDNSVVLELPTPSHYTGNSFEASPSLAFQEFVIDTIERFAPDVTRISDTHAASILPIIGCLINVRCVVVESQSCLHMDGYFPTNDWNVKLLYVGSGEAIFRRTMLIANRR